MENAEPPKLSLADVLNLKVEDIREKPIGNFWHLPGGELHECLSWIRHLRAEQKKIDHGLDVDANELEEKLGHISAGRDATSPSNTKTLPPPDRATVLKQNRLVEKTAYEILIEEGGQPSHPINPELRALDEPGKYKDIISYWKSYCDCGGRPFETQLNRWRYFRYWQDETRERYESQNKFPEYPQHVNERRRRYNLEGNANIRLERTQQSGLEDWMEYQNFQLHRREGLEEQFKEAVEELDASKRGLDEAGDSAFREALKDIDPDGPNSGKWAEHNRKFWMAQKRLESAEREVELLKDSSEAAELDSSKGTSQRAQIKAASALEGAMERLENVKKIKNKVLPREKMFRAERRMAFIKRNLKWNKIMVDWVEQQYTVIASRPLLDSEGSEPLATKRTLLPQMGSISRKRNQSAEIPIGESKACKRRRSKRIASLKEKKQARDQEGLPPLHPSSDQTSTNQQSTNCRLRNRRNDGKSESHAKVQLRRSPRVSKKPERVCPG